MRHNLGHSNVDRLYKLLSLQSGEFQYKQDGPVQEEDEEHDAF